MSVRIDKKTYDELTDAFLDKPGNMQHAMDRVGVAFDTAKRSWIQGWPKRGWAPIKSIVEQAQSQARVLLQEKRAREKTEEQAERERARKHAIKSMAEEGELVEASRHQMLELLKTAGALTDAAGGLSKTLKNWLAVEDRKISEWVRYEAINAGIINGTMAKPKWEQPKTKPEDMAVMIKRAADLAQTIVNTSRQVMEMERIYLGKPTQIIQVADDKKEITVEEAEVRMKAAIQAFESASRHEKLVVLQGGNPAPVKVGKRVIVPSGGGTSST